MTNIFIAFFIWLTPLILFILIKRSKLEPGSTVSDLFTDLNCKKCRFSKGYCGMCSVESNYALLTASLFIPIINIVALLIWLLNKPVSNMWNKFINSKIK